jgi:hypothetical protein
MFEERHFPVPLCPTHIPHALVLVPSLLLNEDRTFSPITSLLASHHSSFADRAIAQTVSHCLHTEEVRVR